jgi:hypothetical protein
MRLRENDTSKKPSQLFQRLGANRLLAFKHMVRTGAYLHLLQQRQYCNRRCSIPILNTRRLFHSVHAATLKSTKHPRWPLQSVQAVTHPLTGLKLWRKSARRKSWQAAKWNTFWRLYVNCQSHLAPLIPLSPSQRIFSKRRPVSGVRGAERVSSVRCSEKVSSGRCSEMLSNGQCPVFQKSVQCPVFWKESPVSGLPKRRPVFGFPEECPVSSGTVFGFPEECPVCSGTVFGFPEECVVCSGTVLGASKKCLVSSGWWSEKVFVVRGRCPAQSSHTIGADLPVVMAFVCLLPSAFI